MKLIIDIPENEYMKIKRYYDSLPEYSTVEAEIYYIAHGTSLDSVVAEIEKLNPVDYGSMFSYESHNGARDMKRDILEILDNIGEESETN